MTIYKQIKQRITSTLVKALDPFGFKKQTWLTELRLHRKFGQIITHEIRVPCANVGNEVSFSVGCGIRFADIEDEMLSLAPEPGFWDPGGKHSDKHFTVTVALEAICEPPRPAHRIFVDSIAQVDREMPVVIDEMARFGLPWLYQHSSLSEAYKWITHQIETSKFPQYEILTCMRSILIARKLGSQAHDRVADILKATASLSTPNSTASKRFLDIMK